jgi:glycosyltransferase involved in cell wall biosynthesis
VVLLRIMMIGQKGIPATYGGIERHVEEVGSRLAERGHDVTVFCRRNYSTGDREYRGMHLRPMRTPTSKHLDAFVHSALSTLVGVTDAPDVIHYHALGPGLWSPLPRYLSASKVVLTVHGLDQYRAKWGRGAQAVLTMAAWMSARVPDVTIGVSRALTDHYLARYGRQIVHISNGVTPARPRPAREIRERYGLAERSYVLFVGRLVPEKAPDLLIDAFRRVRGDLRLVIVGGSSFTDRYAASLRELALADPRVILTGYEYGQTIEELYSNAAVFVLPSLLEGLPLTLLEAAAYGVPIVASDIPPHLEVVTRDAPGHRLFRSGDARSLAEVLEAVIENHASEQMGAQGFSSDVVRTYCWDDVAQATEDLYRRLVTLPQPLASPRQVVP